MNSVGGLENAAMNQAQGLIGQAVGQSSAETSSRSYDALSTESKWWWDDLRNQV